jgi:DNA-binding XRE family transcriptional regulator
MTVQSDQVSPSVPALVIRCGDRDYTVTPGDGPITIGRQFPAQVVVDDPRISRNHLRLEAGAQGWVAHDHSSNGVFIGGQPRQEFRVTDAVTVHLGHPDGIPVHFRLTTVTDTADIAHAAGPGVTDSGGDGGGDGDDAADVTMAVGDNDIGVTRAGAAVRARREQLDISQRKLAAEGIVNAGALIAFEKGRSWPRRATRDKLEEILQWPPGTIVAIRRGTAHDIPGVDPTAATPPAPAPHAEDATAVVTTNIVGAPLLAQAVQVALGAVSTRVQQLDLMPAEQQYVTITELLGELRNLEKIAAEAAANATQAPSVVMALSDVRRTYRSLMLRAAGSRRATAGQQLFAARDRAQLSIAEAANAAGVTPADIAAAEADHPLNPAVASAISALLNWLRGQ